MEDTRIEDQENISGKDLETGLFHYWLLLLLPSHYIRYTELNWYGHMRRMAEKSLLRNLFEWCPPGRIKKKKKKKKGKTSNLWIQEVTTGMGEKGITSVEWIDRKDDEKK